MRKPRNAIVRVLLPAFGSLLLLTACGGSATTEPEASDPTTTAPDNTAPAGQGYGGGYNGDSEGSGGSGGATGGSDPDAGGSGNSTAPTPDEGNYTVELHVTVTPEAGAEPRTYLLQCEGTTPSQASNVSKPEAACALMEESAQALFFTPPDPTLLCTQQYGGPQTATVTGSIHGRTVEAKFARTDGCEISRWNAMEPVLGTGGVL